METPDKWLMKEPTDIDSLVNQSGLRVRLFLFNMKAEKEGWREKPYLEDFLTEFFDTNVPHNVDFFNESDEEVIKQLQNSKFMGYASIIIIVYRQPTISIWRSGFNKFVKAFESNRYLRHKSKLLLMSYPVLAIDYLEAEVNNNYLIGFGITKLDDVRCPKKVHRIKVKQITDDVVMACATMDYKEMQAFQLENTLMVQSFVMYRWALPDFINNFFFEVFMSPFISMQEFLTRCVSPDSKLRLVKSTTNTGLYFYAINPCLSIIINNYYFTKSPHTMRSGSDSDVEHLVRVLKLAGIPYILVEDCNRQELLDILDYVAIKNFNPLKTILLCLMSHGDENNVFYTDDGQLDIYADVVDRLQSNPSLIETKKVVLVNACRGSIDLENDMDEITNSVTTSAKKNSNLMENTFVWHGVPVGIQSPRSHIWGSPFIQSFCHHFLNLNVNDDVRLLDARINSDLSQLDYFHGLIKCSDLSLKDPKQCCTLVQKPIKALEMLKLIESIKKEFPNCETPENQIMPSQFLYVCGVLNYGKYPKNDDIKNKYFTPELENEQCEVESHPSKIFGENIL